MKILCHIFFLLISNLLCGQSYKQIQTNTESYYWLTDYDSINFNLEFPDGRYIISQKDDSLIVKYAFFLEANKVSGPFCQVLENKGIYFGNYYNDSLWTFLTNPSDTTFKYGLWETVYDMDLSSFKQYKIPNYTIDSIYIEKWLLPSGKTFLERTYKNGFGVVEEKRWHWNSPTKLTRHLIYNPNYSIETYYNVNDSVNYISVKQKLGKNNVMLSNEIYLNTPCTNGYEYCDKIQIITDDKMKFLRISDQTNDLKLEYMLNGDIIIRYLNGRGKPRKKKIKRQVK